MACCDSLQAEVGILFEEFVIPTNVIQQCRSILTKKEIQYVEAKAKNKGPSEAARRLFNILVQKEGWFAKVQILLCDQNVKLQHIADMMTQERNRFSQPQSARYRRSHRNTRYDCETLSALYIKYNKDLGSNIHQLFVARIGNPVMALHVFQKYSGGRVLTKIDCDNVEAEFNNKGEHEGAVLLFSRLVLYDDWLNVLLQALRDDEIRLSDVAEDIKSFACGIKEDYEKKRSKIQHLYNTEENMQLTDNCAATVDPGCIEMTSDTRGRPLREANFRDECESDFAEMMPVMKRQAVCASNKENTVSDCSGDSRDLAVQGGSSEDKHGTTGNTKLMSAAASGDINLLLSLIAGGADLDESDRKGITSLMYAVLNHQVECIRLLISEGCNVNKRDINGCTALMISADKGFSDCMAFLIEAKADLDNANNAGVTALMVAARNGFVDCMQLLIVKDCDIDKCNNDGRTALMFAASEGHSKCVDLLITSSRFVDERDNKRATALMYAAKCGQQECVTLLINGGADVNLVDKECKTAVMYAVEFNRVECLKILIDNQADINIVKKDGTTPLKVAKGKKLSRCLKILKAAKRGR